MRCRFSLPARLLGVLLAVAAALVSSVPEAAAQRTHFGLRMGFTSTTLAGTSNTDFTFRQALAGGAIVRYRLNDRFELQPELLYVLKGARTDDAVIEGQSTDLKATVSIAYIELPVSVVYEAPVRSRIKPRVHAGGFVARNVDAQIKLTSKTSGRSSTEEDDSIARTDFGLHAGAGIAFPLAGQSATLDLRGSFGTRDVRDRPDAPLRNTSILLLMGLTF